MEIPQSLKDESKSVLHEDSLIPEAIAIEALSSELQGRPNRRRKKLKRAMIGLLLAGMLSTSILSDQEKLSPYEAVSMHIVNEGNACPPDADFGIVNVSGVGMSSIGIYAARQSMKILGDNYTFCSAGQKYGSEYSPTNNAENLHSFAETSGLDKIIIFAHSFGGIATFDMLSEYKRLYPNDKLQTAVVFFSSPGNIDDLHFGSRTTAHVLSITQLPKPLIWGITYFGIISQGDKSLTDPKLYEDTSTCTEDTPPKLLWEEVNRLKDGIDKLPAGMKIPMFYVGDEKDQIVDINKAILTIEQRVGQDFSKVIFMSHSDERLNNHAALFWEDYENDYKFLKDLTPQIIAATRA